MKTHAYLLVLVLLGCSEADGGPSWDGDTDGDTIPPECLEIPDMDCDGDYLSNGLEEELGLDPANPDSDGDGTNDIAELALCCPGGDPHAAGCAEAIAAEDCGLDPDEYYVVLPYEEDVEDDLVFGTDLQQADVYFLVDTTGSMEGEIEQLKLSLAGLAGELLGVIPDVAFGVGHFEDFPAYRWDPETPDDGILYGREGDLPFEHLQSMTTDLTTAQNGVDRLYVPHEHSGLDLPESQVEALYQIATASGLDPFLDAPGGCLEDMFGWPCFRKESLPIIIQCTDAAMHNGPDDGTSEAYDDAFLTSELGIAGTHTWPEAMDAINAIGARVMTLWSLAPEDEEYDDRADHEATATATGAVADGPLVFDINPDGTGIGEAVVDAVLTLAGQVPMDVSTTWEESPGVADGIDGREFIASITPVSATPSDGITGIEGDTFTGVEPSTRLDFDVLFENRIVEEREGEPQLFLLRIVVLGDGTARLDELRVVVLVPPASILI